MTGVNTGLSTSDMRELLLRCTSNIQFKFDGHLHQQTGGVAMGSPLGPLSSDLLMSSPETGSLRDAINSMCFYRRYVGNILVIPDSHTDADASSNSFSHAHPSIQFMVEFEKSNTSNFLSVLLYRRLYSSIKRSVHMKPTWTRQCAHFTSFASLSQRRNLIRQLTHRANLICSADTHEARMFHLIDVLK